MATATYDLLDSTTLGTAAASVTFSGISGDYRDLVLISEFKSNAGSQEVTLRFNADAGSNYSTVNANGGVNGIFSSSATSTSIELSASFVKSDSSSDIVQCSFTVLDYSATDKHKTILNRFGTSSGTRAGTNMSSGRWADTSAITSLEILASVNFASGGTFYLYGVAA